MANRKYTAVHWLGAEILVEPFEARTDRAAREEFEQMGWNAYDDRALLNGHCSEAEVRALRLGNDARPQSVVSK